MQGHARLVDARETTTFGGKHYQLKHARLKPKSVQKHLVLVFAGTGERRTPRIVAERADVWNTIAGVPNAYPETSPTC